jgi:pyruvate kinase
MARRTKIIATMGPSTQDPEVVRAMVAAGMDVARLNFSHGTADDHRQMAEWIRTAADAEGRSVGILQDIQGPKLRLGTFPEGPHRLTRGETVEVISSEVAADGAVPIVYDGLLRDVALGHRIILADGLVRLRVTDVGDDRLHAEVELSGIVSDRKGVAFPDSDLDTPTITEKDEADLVVGREIGVDYVAVSFVRGAADLERVREIAGDVPLIAKIELASGYERLDEILSVADGAMVARGDLGVQYPIQRIPAIQLDILQRTNRAALLSITATEMLETMTHAPRPTRAEVTDVTNAVRNGTDAVMLSGETAVGDYPVRVVEVMAIICEEADLAPSPMRVDFLSQVPTFASATAKAAVQVVEDLGLHTIVAFTESGTTARLLSKYRPEASVIAFTPEPGVFHRMALYRGVKPLMFDRRDTTDLMLAAAEKHLEKYGLAEKDEVVVMVAGIPPNQQASTNLLKLHVIGERARRGTRRFGASD